MRQPIDAAIARAVDDRLAASMGGDALEIRRRVFVRDTLLEQQKNGAKEGDVSLLFELAKKVLRKR